MYGKDKLWTETKHYAKNNGFSEDWSSVIDLYYSEGGKNVEVYCILDSGKHRVIGLTDTREVILLDRNLRLTIEDHKKVLESQKTFFYNDNENNKTYRLPGAHTFRGVDSIDIPMTGR